jgi:sulfotransferase family protein
MIEPRSGLDAHPIEICPDPIFVVGSPRSGTTILAHALGHHSRLWTSEESHFISLLFGRAQAERAFHTLERRAWPTWLVVQGVGEREFLEYLGYGVNALFTSRSQGKRWIDHTPPSTLMLDTLARMFPGAFFLHMLRDGRRVVHSMCHIRNSPRNTPEILAIAKFEPWSDDFRAACRTWRQHVEAAMSFAEKNPARCLTVVNEQLVLRPDQEFARIFEFIREPYMAGPTNYFRSNRINSSFYPDSENPALARELAQPWRSWSAEQKRIFVQEAGETLIKFDLGTLADLDELAGAEAEPWMTSPSGDSSAGQRVQDDLERAALEQWAHDLERTVIAQETVIRQYRRWTAPLRPFIQLARKVKGGYHSR